MTVAMIVYGIGLRREEVTPRWIPWCLIAGGVLVVPIGSFVVTYVPHGILLTLLTPMALALLGLQTANETNRPSATTGQ